MTDELMEVFFDVQSELPRQGPGDDDSTRRALDLCRPLSAAARVLDVGCGPGAQTLVLAEELKDARIRAVDIHQPYLDDLEKRAAAAGVRDRVSAMKLSMDDLPFDPESFDLIWAEGSAYIMGIEKALAAWKPLLKRGGFLAFTELVWLSDDRKKEAADFFGREYPAMMDRSGVAGLVREAGYELVAEFTLPDSAWWEPYYTPLLARLPGLEAKYAGSAAKLSVIAETRREIEIRRRFASCYGYEFYVAQKSK